MSDAPLPGEAPAAYGARMADASRARLHPAFAAMIETPAERERRLADAAETGRRAADATCALIESRKAESGRMFVMRTNFEVARRIANASGGTEQDALRIAYEAGTEPLQPPRPRLVEP